MNSMLRGAVASLSVLACPLAVLAEEITVQTYRGEVGVPAGPEVVAVLDVAAMDTLDALGVAIAGVPQPHYVSYLDDVASGAKAVGTLFEPDFETLAAMGPDLIVVGGRSSKQAEALARIAPTIDMTISADEGGSLRDQALARLDAYGTIFGLEEKAAELRSGLETRLAEVGSAVQGKGNALIVLTNGPKISAYGIGSRFGWIHEELGLPEAHENVDAQTHGEAISFEFIAEVDPDWLIVVDRGAAIGAEGASAAETLDNELVRKTKAWSNGHVVYLDAGSIYIAGGGLQAMHGVLDQIEAAFEG